MNYTKEQINEIKNKIDYLEFYKEYLPDLTQRGKLAWALCCFHNDKHPSLSVSLNYGIYRCWSCGEHGDVITFVQKYHNINFNEAVEFLAEKYNVTLEVSDEVKAQRERRKALININKTMSEKFQLSLENNNNAWNYLTQIRGLSPKIIQDFKLGCGIDKLPNKESLKILGLISTGEYGEYTAFPSNRIMIPRINEKGEVVSFTGRLYTDDKGSKYKHTVNTEIYNKSEFVFGLYQAKKYIKHFNSAVLVEGEMDVIKCHQKGIVNAVCLSGVTVDDKQINLLKKYTNTFYVCVEDGAILGENIIDKKQPTPLEKLYKSIKDNIPYAKVYIVDLRNKDGSKCDPDMYLEKHTREEFKELLKKAKIYNEYILSNIISRFNPKNVEEKSSCINIIVPRLIEINNYLDRKQYIELVANKLMVSENDIYRQIKVKTNSEDKLRTENITWDNKPVYAQKVLLSICLAPNFGFKRALSLVSLYAENLMEPFYKNILNNIIKPLILSQNTSEINLNEMFTDINHGDVDNIIKQTIINCYMKVEQFEDLTEDDLEELIQEQCETLKEWYIPQHSVDIESTLQEELENISV